MHKLVNEPRLRSPLAEAMRVNPSRGRRGRRKMVMALVLTSLVDAFSIMLLYLLCQNTGIGSTLELNQTKNLPSAVKAEPLHQGTLVRVENGKYFLSEKPIESVELAARLQEIKASGSTDSDALIIQADKTADFAALIPVIRAGSLSGFNKFRFAVRQEEAKL